MVITKIPLAWQNFAQLCSLLTCLDTHDSLICNELKHDTTTYMTSHMVENGCIYSLFKHFIRLDISWQEEAIEMHIPLQSSRFAKYLPPVL